MLPHLIGWQKKHGYPLQFACEATLNMAKQTEILELMREAGFFTVFVGIETPELDALKSIAKDHNNAVPMFEALEHAQLLRPRGHLRHHPRARHRIGRIRAAADRVHRPLGRAGADHQHPAGAAQDAAVGPSAKADRLVDDPKLELNVKFLRPHDSVVASWRRAIAHAYAPENIFARFRHQMDVTYGNRIKTPAKGKLTRANLRRAVFMGWNIIWQIGVKSDYRGVFWRSAWHAAKKGQIEAIYNMAFVCHHLIKFTREARARRAQRELLRGQEGSGGGRGVVGGGGCRGGGVGGFARGMPARLRPSHARHAERSRLDAPAGKARWRSRRRSGP